MPWRTMIDETVTYLKSHYPHPISLVAILGSGLGELADDLPGGVKVSFAQIPHFPHSSVAGHQGAVVFAELAPGFHGAFCQGRVHFYEGHSMADVVYPLRALKKLGAETLIVTNAAGGVNPDFSAGTLMLIRDHINAMGTNPLIGPNDDALGPRFPDMSEAYSAELRKVALSVGDSRGIALKEGVYYAVSGPSYETPAEVRMIGKLGGDAVGMSTVPEVIAARHMGMQVLGISCVTNPAAGVLAGHVLNHEEVLETANRVKQDFKGLVNGVIGELVRQKQPVG